MMVISQSMPPVLERETSTKRVMKLLLIVACVYSRFLITVGNPTTQVGNLAARKREECVCSYFHRDQNLLSVVNGQKEKFGVRLRKGQSTLLRCANSSMNLIWPNGACASKTAILRCNKCEKWNADHIPSCQASHIDPGIRIHCTKFPEKIMDHLIVNYDDNNIRIGSKATFSCRKNDTELKGTSLAVCLRSGDWSTPPPQCTEPQIRCPPIDGNGDFVIVYSNDRNIHSTATFYCKDVSQIIESIHTSTCLSTGEWSLSNPMCKDPIIRCTRFSNEDINLLVVDYDDSDSPVGSTAAFTCREKDKILNGMNVTVCLRSGEWSSPPPQCIEPQIRCPLIDGNGDFVVVYSNDRNINSTASFYCKEVSQIIEGLHTKTCLLTGEWSDASPTCKVGNPTTQVGNLAAREREGCVCSYFHRDQNLLSVGNGRKEKFAVRLRKGQSTLLRCANSSMNLIWPNGACASKTAILRCNKCEKWNADHIPSCQASHIDPIIRCSRFSNVDINLLAVDYDENDTRVGSTATFSCRESNKILNGTSVTVCLRSGEWSSPPPQCIEPRCEVPLAPEHGSVHTTNGQKVGSRALYTCNKDATLVGPSYSKCLMNGEWTFSPPDCLRSYELPPVPGGWAGHYKTVKSSWLKRYQRFFKLEEGKIIKHGESVILHCERGYTLVENSTFDGHRFVDEVTCENGMWSKPLQCKSGRCSDLVLLIAHGNPVNFSQEHNSKLEFECDQGFELKGSSTIQCRYGEWTGQAPECVGVPTCDPPENPENGKVVYTSLQFGSNLTIECDNGYHLEQMKPVFCKQDRTWNVTDLKCIAIYCDFPDTPENGNVFYASLKFGSELQFECDEGYRLQQTNPVYCTSNGTWSEAEVACDAIYCDIPDNPENGHVNYTSLKFGSELQFECEDGYRLQQTYPMYCTLKGTWSSANATCDAIYCDIPDNPENGNALYTSLKFGSELQFECDEGYRLQQTKPVHCTSNGTWSGAEVTCDADSCDPPKDPKNGKVTYTSLKLGSQLAFECNNGYRLQDTEPVYCTSHRKWSKADVSCVVQTCILKSLLLNLPEEVIPETSVGDADYLIIFPYNSTVKLTCGNDAHTEDSKFAKCGNHGEWEFDKFLCVTGCPLPLKSSGSKLIITPENDFFHLGETVIFSCPHGLSLDRDLERMMCLDGGWSSKVLPECVQTYID